MQTSRRVKVVRRALLACTLAFALPLAAQQQPTPPAPTPVAKLVAEPASLTLKAGEAMPLKVTAYDADGKVIPDALVRVVGPRRAFQYADSKITAFTAGSFKAVAQAMGAGVPVTLDIPVTVTWPALASLEIVPPSGPIYDRMPVQLAVVGKHADGSERKGLTVQWSASTSLVDLDRFGSLRARRPLTVVVTASAEGVTTRKTLLVVANPVASLAITTPDSRIKTGDVLHLTALAKRADGRELKDAPIIWTYSYTPDDSIAAPGGPGIIDGGLFTGNYAGRYTIFARIGTVEDSRTIEVAPRDVRQKINVTGRGNITSTHTSDLWPWTGKDGRDYAIVGTWGGDGYAIIFDITDLGNPVKTDSIKVDARTINDVTVSPDGRYAAVAREGASNRINGVVILDLANPAHPTVASTFDQELTGGVHNMFATNDHLFAVSGGAKYVIIDVKDITKPKYVSEYRHPNARIHDLWVRDGIAYSAQGGAGTVVVDVGNGKYGGTIEKPKLITVFPINSGHEIYPYFQAKTGKTYLFIGDEEMNREGRAWEGTQYFGQMFTSGGTPQTSGGYVHIVDFTDPMHPKKVGRYHLEDFGSHDIIVEDDVLYQAYYEGGVRMVDVSGELLGNLADQGREIAVYKPFDAKGYTPNASFVMNAMPWKGHVLFTDFNTGLWAAKLEPKAKSLTP